MAKKTKRIIFQLECTVCKERNYTTSKNTLNQKGKMNLEKYCSRCRKHTEHKEVRIPNPKKK
jgi:large subunit ribosomal protein L33